MVSARQLRRFSWIVPAILIPCGWCGVLAAAPYSGGDGTPETPYLLSTAADLATLADTQADWGKWFILTADIDMKATPLVKPIGSRPAPFTGVFDGGRHSIRNLTANDTAVASTPFGLFGSVGLPAVIERLRLIAPSIKTVSNGSTGVLAGETIKGATIQQCSVEGGSVSTPGSECRRGAGGGQRRDRPGVFLHDQCHGPGTGRRAARTQYGPRGELRGGCRDHDAESRHRHRGRRALGGGRGGHDSILPRHEPRPHGARVGGLVGYASPTTIISNSVCNQVAAKAVENWPADVPGSAWCEEASNLASDAFFTGLGWDLRGTWFMDLGGVLRLRWVSGGLTAVAKGPSGTIPPDPKTGLARIALDGTQSSDPEGSALRYSWKCLTAGGEPTGITIAPVANPTIDLPSGAYRIELTVNNGRADSAPATLTFTVGGGASKVLPTAVIKGPAGVVRPDPATGLAKVTLDGSPSTDPDKKALKYSWRCLTFSGGPTGITISPVAVPALSLRRGVYRIELTVSNGTADSAPAILMVSVNTAPTALIRAPGGNITPDATTGLARVLLDGTGSSDPDKDALKYSWKCLTPSGGATGVTIDPVASPSVSLRSGTYRIELTVNDGVEDSASFPVSLTIGGFNNPPTAVIKALEGMVRPDAKTGLAQIALDGSLSSDPDGDMLKYRWRCLTAGGGAMALAVDPVPNPVVRLGAGMYKVELTVNDGVTDSAPFVVSVTINTPPVAKAGDSQSLFDDGTGARLVKLDGSRSFDPEVGKGQTLVYSWTCSTAKPGTASGPTPSLAFPTGTHTVVLTVSDGVESAEDRMQITVVPPLAGARTAASPSIIGRASLVPDVEFYLLLPAGRSVSEVDTQAPLSLDINGARIPLARDLTYSHKKYTVAASGDRQKILAAAGVTNGTKTVTMSLRLRTGEIVCGAVYLQITPGSGPNLATVLAERTGYYFDTKTWK